MAAQTLYIIWRGNDSTSFDWFVQTGELISQSGRSDLNTILSKKSGNAVVLVVPTEDIFLTTVNIPTRQSHKLKQAVPFVLEDQLVDDIERLHFAVGRADGSGERSVAVVARSKMEAWLQPFDSAGLKINQLVPDIFFVPYDENNWTLLLENDVALLRTARDGGYALPEADTLSLISGQLATLDAEEKPKPESLTVIDCQNSDGELSLDGLSIPVESRSCGSDVKQIYASGLLTRPDLDLLQGDFNRKEQIWRKLRPWRGVAALFVSTVVLNLVGWGIEYQRLVEIEQQLQQSIEKSYRTAFPEARKVINPRLQMEQKLAKLKQGEVCGDFTPLMVNAIPLLLEVNGIRMDVLRYKPNSLEIDLSLKDLQSIDHIKEVMAESAFKVTVQNASATGGRAKGRIVISRRAS